MMGVVMGFLRCGTAFLRVMPMLDFPATKCDMREEREDG
jgi:hypothetical protein